MPKKPWDQDLVTDPTQPEPQPQQTIEVPPEEVLVQNWAAIGAVAGLAAVAWAVGYSIFVENKPKEEAKPTVCQCNCHCQASVDASNVKESLTPSSSTPASFPDPSIPTSEPGSSVPASFPDPSTPTSEPGSSEPGSSVPASFPDPSTPISEPGSSEPGSSVPASFSDPSTPTSEPIKPGTQNLVPVDSALHPQDSATAKYIQILDDMKTMEFADAESFEAYFQHRMGEAGIEGKMTGEGYKVRDLLPDPARVAAQLRSNGIKDRDLIERAVNEANSAIYEIEDHVQVLQKNPSMLSLPAPGELHTETIMDKTTPTGVNIKAYLEEETSKVDSDLKLGFYPAPFRSVFVDAPNAWDDAPGVWNLVNVPDSWKLKA